MCPLCKTAYKYILYNFSYKKNKETVKCARMIIKAYMDSYKKKCFRQKKSEILWNISINEYFDLILMNSLFIII